MENTIFFILNVTGISSRTKNVITSQEHVEYDKQADYASTPKITW